MLLKIALPLSVVGFFTDSSACHFNYLRWVQAGFLSGSLLGSHQSPSPLFSPPISDPIMGLGRGCFSFLRSIFLLIPVLLYFFQAFPLSLRDKTDQKFRDFLYSISPEIKAAADLSLRFKELFQTKMEGALDGWLQDALLPQSELKGFVKGLKGDFEPVNQPVISSISNGQVEGQVNRLKNIKRGMYGRAGFQLLRKIVLFNSG